MHTSTHAVLYDPDGLIEAELPGRWQATALDLPIGRPGAGLGVFVRDELSSTTNSLLRYGLAARSPKASLKKCNLLRTSPSPAARITATVRFGR